MSDTSLSLTITEQAAKQIKTLQEKHNKQGLMLRVSISGGGCSGFQYNYNFDSEINDDDIQFEKDGAIVISDETSLELINGSELDYKTDLMGAIFTIENPNATTSCGCGSSFSVEM